MAFSLLFAVVATATFALDAKSTLLHDIQYLADDRMSGRKTATSGAQLARGFIQRRFSTLGLMPLKDNFQHPFRYSSGWSGSSGKDGINLIAKLEGCSHPETYIVVTAHYDHLGREGGKIYNGADDNASGVAAMLALAELLQRQSCPHYSYLFVATDAEETGLYGAKAFVASPVVPLQQVVLNLNLDMLSRGERTNTLYLYGAFSLPGVADYLKTQNFAVQLKLRNRSKGLRGQHSVDWANASDHAPFRKAGIPFLFFGVDGHNQYHTPDDDWQRINADYLQRMFDSLSKVVVWLDSQPPEWYQAARKIR